MNEGYKKITVTFGMDNPLHKEAWDILKSLPKGKRTEYICKKLTERNRSEELSDVVYQNMMKALKEYGGEIRTPTRIQDNKAEEIQRNLLGFVASLQEEGDDEY